jgi:hypothetical protein
VNARQELVLLLLLSAIMSECPRQEDVLTLLNYAVPVCTSCDVAAGYLRRNGKLVRSAVGWLAPEPALDVRVSALGGADAPVTVRDRSWAAAIALCGPDLLIGYVVLTARGRPKPDEVLRLRLLIRHATSAMVGVTLRNAEREHSRRLRTLNAQVDEARQRSGDLVAEDERRTTVRERLARSVGEQAVADTLQTLTGFPVAVEDPFGNLRFWSGPDRPEHYPKPDEERRDELLRQAVRRGGVVRERDRLLAVARPRREVLGALVLVGARARAGPHDVYALEQASAALGLELAHRRELVELESRLLGELVNDLITGGDPDRAADRSEAVGHDLHGPHQVLVIDWGDVDVYDAVTRAAGLLRMPYLIGRRADMMVLVATGPAPARKFYRLLSRELGIAGGAIGVGGRADSPAQLPRSFREASQALVIRRDSRSPDGLAVFDDLGLYRILHAGQQGAEIERYVWEWLGPLLDYDRQHHAELTNTLFQYLECGGNYAAAANALVIHRSTLRYRLRRIRDIGHIDLSNVDSKLNLHVAVRAWHILTGTGREGTIDVPKGG